MMAKGTMATDFQMREKAKRPSGIKSINLEVFSKVTVCEGNNFSRKVVGFTRTVSLYIIFEQLLL